MRTCHVWPRDQIKRITGALVLQALFAPVVTGQPAVHLSGRVLDSLTRAGVIGAEVRLGGTPRHVWSDDRGNFSLDVTGSTEIVLEVRRLGYRPARQAVTSRARPIEIALANAGPSLNPIQIRAARTRYSGRLAGYYRRLEHRTQGLFISREDLEREKPTQLTDMLQRQPGVRITRGRPGAQSIRMRGRECRPLVWLDGTAMPAGDVDLDSFSPTSLEGIELYLGSSAPAGFQAARGQSECGTLLLWSRGVDTEPHRETMITPAELEELLATLTVFSADQVERRATLDTIPGWSVPYPPSLQASGTSGRVVAEFVVDTLGRVELAHFGIVSSTHPLFSGAVRESAVSARFSPAIRGGKRVRQLVRQPFDFHSTGNSP